MELTKELNSLMQEVADKAVNGVLTRMIELMQGQQAQHLENCTGDAQLALSEEGEQTMAKRRFRVWIDNHDDGTPAFSWKSAKNEREQSEITFLTMLNSPIGQELLRQNGFTQQMTQLSSKPVMTFENYALEWLKSKPNLNTRATYGKYLKADINPYFGNKRLDEITLDDMFTFFSGLQEDDYAKSTANSLKTVIKQVLQCAVTDGYIHVNPAADPRIKNPCTKETERKPLTEEQWSDIVHQIHDKLYNDDRLYMYLVSYTAARKGEVLAMRYEDFDFDKLKLTISRNVTFPDGYNPNIGPTKGKKIRTIDISKELAEELRARFKTCPKKGFLFHREGDFEKPYTSNLFWQMWERIRKSIDLHGATSHVFRHTVLTMLNNKGVDLKTISAIAGHASETTTYTYIHTNDAKKKEAMSLLTANVA